MASRVPQDPEAERQVLGSLILQPDLILQISSVIRRDDFFLESNRIIYDALLELNQNTAPVDALQVINFLRDRNLLDQGGGGKYILGLVEDVMAPGNAGVHAKRISQIALRRKLMESISEISDEASEPQEDEGGFLRSVEERILKITSESETTGIQSVSEIKQDFSDYVKKLVEARGGLTGQPTRFGDFDTLTSGLRGGELIILAARPGMGKTTFALNIASNIAIHYKKPILLYSLEMGRHELLLRMVCSESQTNHSDMKRGNIVHEKVQPVLSSIDRIFSSPLYIDDSGTLDIWDCVTRTRKMAVDLKRKGESLGLIIIDYLQLMTDPQSRKHGRQHEVATVSRSLKQLAKAVDAPVMALSQMNRSVEQRRGESARPQLSDLRESGAIEQDADIVMFIHREFSKEDDPESIQNRGLAEIIIAKHRNGPLGSFKVAFRPEINRFDNLSGEIP
ncbi:MAG: replicative DNA helicase [Spirochaetia bacterium]|nr:replicative DNA helicase [Spirochaetia bacterium]